MRCLLGERTDACSLAAAGLSFEKKILSNEEKNVKFNFLRPTDPYHGYYRHKARSLSPALGVSVCIAEAVRERWQAWRQLKLLAPSFLRDGAVL